MVFRIHWGLEGVLFRSKRACWRGGSGKSVAIHVIRAKGLGSTTEKRIAGVAWRSQITGKSKEGQTQMKSALELFPFQASNCWRLAAFIALALFGQSAIAETSPAPKPDLVGQVQTKEGSAVHGVTVFIETAGPKVGTSPFCPSCYADCRKSAKTDAQGNFKIESLDPQLVFRILIAGKGYKPKYVSKVDPAKGPMKAELEPFDASKASPENSLRGRVVNPKGKPIEGAVVESHGVHRGSGTMWGSLPGIDPLAVTDEHGEFVITAKEPFDALDVIVDARTFAKKTFTSLARGTEFHELQMSEGATVSGRVVQKDKPLPNVSVGIVSVDRGMENFTGNFELGTDAEGRFAFVNLPPNVKYYIYGIMETIKPVRGNRRHRNNDRQGRRNAQCGRPRGRSGPPVGGQSRVVGSQYDSAENALARESRKSMGFDAR